MKRGLPEALAAGIVLALSAGAPNGASAGPKQKQLEAAQKRAEEMIRADEERRRKEIDARNARLGASAAARDAEQARKKCERAWSAYGSKLRHEIDRWADHDVVDFPPMPETKPWNLQSRFDQAVKEAELIATQDPDIDTQYGPIQRLMYYLRLGTGENRPSECGNYPFEAASRLKTNGKAIGERHNALVEAAQERLAKKRQLEQAHRDKVFAAIKRAGAKTDSFYTEIANSVIESGMAEVRGRAVSLDVGDSEFVLLQVLPGGKALFHHPFDDYDEFPTIIVTGLKTADLMHGAALTDVGVKWVKVVGFVNYRNPLGGQAQAIQVKPLRKIPPPERPVQRAELR